MQTPSPEHRIIRDRISRKMSFPIGYELLERVFGDLPQWPDCDFWFDGRPGYWASDFASTLKSGDPYPIVRVGRSLSAGFTFSVYPVVRSLKSIAREAFLSSAVEAFREFISAGPRGGFLDALFAPAAHTCTVRGPKK